MSQPTSILGRERELGEISALLADPACRLVTLLGPGGTGKTRLALEIAGQQRLQASFADGVVLVDLAGTAAPDFLLAAIGGALEIPFWGTEEPLTQSQSYLSDKQVLLVVDNLEHLLAGSGCLADLLSAAPALKILATSRERLNLREEWVYAVGCLAFPPGYAGISAVSEDEALAVKLVLANPQASASPTALLTGDGQPLREPLSPREHEVLQLLGQGLSNAEIAQKLVISTATVKVHTRNHYGKLDVSNRAQAVLPAQKLHLL